MGHAAADPFVGRQAELALLGEHLERARAGCSQVVLIEGPAGVGKTALMQAFLLDAGVGGVLRTSGEEAEELVTYGVVEQLTRSAAAVGAVVPGLPPRVVEEPPVVGAALVELVDGLQQRGLVVVAFDDAHWADLPSVQALVFALRRLRADQVLVIVTARDQGSHRIERIRHLATGDGGGRLRLAGLAVPALIEFAEAMGTGVLPVRAARRLHAHTAGLPLHVKALFEEVGPEVLRAADVPLPAPASYGALVLGRLSACSPQARQLVVAAAVLGERCSLDSARRLAGDAGLETVGEAVAAQLLTLLATDGEMVVEFAHQLVRTAIYRDLDIGTRLALHAQAARLVEGREAVLGHRTAAAMETDDGLAGELAECAAELAGRGEPERAASQLLSAARLHRDADGRARCLLEAVELRVLAGDVDGALSLVEAVAAVRPSPRRSYVQALLEFAAGRPAAAEAPLLAAWEAAAYEDGAKDPALCASVAGWLCQVCYLQLRSEEAVQWGVRARAADPRRLSWLVTSMALAGRPLESAPLGTGAAALDGPSGDDLDVALARGAQRLWTEDLTGARVALVAVAAGLRRRGLFMARLQALGYLVLAETRLGAFDDAIAHAEEAISLAQDADQNWTLARLHSFAAHPHAMRGDFDRAEEHLKAAWEEAGVTGLRLDEVGARVAQANVADVRADHATVVATLEPLARAAGGSGEPGVSLWPCRLADALVHLGRPEEAEWVLAPYERKAVARRRQLAQAACARVRGRLEAAAGRPEAAEQALRRAITLAENGPSPLEECLGRWAYGAFLRRAGRRRDAATELRAAREGLLRLGAAPLVARCDRELEACGLAPGRRREREAHRLTPRELCVARLVATGMSNPQVAAELVVSINTVEFHLRNVFAKFGIGTRNHIAAHLGPAPQVSR